MIHFRPGSQLHRLITVLSVSGEYPTKSLYLLGNERVYKSLTHKLTSAQTIRNSQTETDITPARVLTVTGKGADKTVRLYKGAIPILRWIGAEEYYLQSFWNHKFPGDSAHRERNHRVAESFAMFMGAGFEFRPYRLPGLQYSEIKRVISRRPIFYPGKSLKQAGRIEANKTMFTRLVGAAFSDGSCHAVYNTRSAVMKWNGKGEFKALHGLIEISRLNAGITNVDEAILFGESHDVALATLCDTEKNHRLEFRFDGIYRSIYFVPLNEIGLRQLRLFTVPDWKEKLLDLFFEPEQRSYDRGVFEYDAYVDGVYVLSHLDGDIARLIRFKESVINRADKYEVLCFEDQVNFLNGYLKDFVQLRVIGRKEVEDALEIKRRNVLEE